MMGYCDVDEKESVWWNTARNDTAWWHSIAKAIIKSGPTFTVFFVNDVRDAARLFCCILLTNFVQSTLFMLILFLHVPYHIAFIMDGNRRFARRNHLDHVIHGHEKGFQQLAKVLEWCHDFGVREVTVYAFSIENFKRNSDEVEGLMKLAEKMFGRLLDDKEKLEEKQIAFRFFGNVALLSPRLRKLLAQIELKTREYSNGVVNVCMPYTSRDEITRAFELVRMGKEKGLLEENQITEWLLSRCLDSRHSTQPRLLIRTSGEKRLSDFLLWQCSCSHVYFDDVLWPEFNYLHLCKAIMSYQYYDKIIQVIGRNQASSEPSEEERLALQPFFGLR
ncbi:di-trans,poly-cis-decaprenylcistransferase [Dictyocaulus viviparus]|uniref:Alkyl transferase n=1 Tax=Dictyocaulus viviparus TaxID=29172 RepID=A0A0D8XAG3_DICVI|nr:di-trans,poly-cis-decaprenylcistransferase [Dictyocaulus viviparus]